MTTSGQCDRVAAVCVFNGSFAEFEGSYWIKESLLEGNEKLGPKKKEVHEDIADS